MNQLRALMNRRMLIVFSMGFSSGLPLLLIGSTLSAWLTESGLTLTSIGLFSLTSMPYVWKFTWSPLLDRYVPPFLGRRRGWLLISQIGLALSLLALALSDPHRELLLMGAIAFVTAFLSATQDIALDAYRREFLTEQEFAFGNSLAITGYRIGMLVAGSLGLILADHVSWNLVYSIMAGLMAIGIVTTLLSPEPDVGMTAPQTLRAAFSEPFLEFFKRSGVIWFLVFVVIYKIGDNMALAMTTPFYLKIGFSKSAVGAIAKTFGVWATITGGLVGGALILRLPIKRALVFFGLLQGVANLGFAVLAMIGPNVLALATVISLETLTAGMGTAALVALMASQTDKRFTATQYALLSSLMGVPRVLTGPPAGYLAEHTTWPIFFLLCTLMAIPGLLIISKIKLQPIDKSKSF